MSDFPRESWFEDNIGWIRPDSEFPDQAGIGIAVQFDGDDSVCECCLDLRDGEDFSFHSQAGRAVGAVDMYEQGGVVACGQFPGGLKVTEPACILRCCGGVWEQQECGEQWECGKERLHGISLRRKAVLNGGASLRILIQPRWLAWICEQTDPERKVGRRGWHNGQDCQSLFGLPVLRSLLRQCVRVRPCVRNWQGSGVTGAVR